VTSWCKIQNEIFTFYYFIKIIDATITFLRQNTIFVGFPNQISCTRVTLQWRSELVWFDLNAIFFVAMCLSLWTNIIITISKRNNRQKKPFVMFGTMKRFVCLLSTWKTLLVKWFNMKNRSTKSPKTKTALNTKKTVVKSFSKS
jgi:hypothetical protein